MKRRKVCNHQYSQSPGHNLVMESEPTRAIHRYSVGDAELDARLQALVTELAPEDPRLTYELLVTAVKLAGEPITRLDRKIINVALKEMRHAFKLFVQYRDFRKATLFGSARVQPGDPDYETAREVGRLLAASGWMVVTGAGPGIMRAGNEGAGQGQSFGFNIVLPFEQTPNEFIVGDAKLINFKYFFTRKLMFIKEADAFILCPGGFGTMDEVFELITLMQTGKSDLHPVVMLESPGGTYWKEWDDHIRGSLMARGFVDPDDLSFYTIAESPADAVRRVETFYRVYHSQRYVGDRLVLRLNRAPSPEVLEQLSREFADIIAGPVEPVPASPSEIKDNDVPDLPRVGMHFDRAHFARLKQLIDRLNELAGGAGDGRQPAG
jgi:uncharacterized protein (TIGR00730 family)